MMDPLFFMNSELILIYFVSLLNNFFLFHIGDYFISTGFVYL